MVAPFHQMSCRPEVAGTSMSISRLLGLCWLVMLFAGSRCAAQPTGSDFGALRSGEVVVWISTTLLNPGDFRTSFPQDFPNAKLLVREVAPETFVSEVERPQTVPPDVAFIDNYQQLGPLIRTNSVWLAWGLSRFSNRGWWVIFKDTQHLAQSQAFIRWLAGAPGWPRAVDNSIPADTAKIVQEASISALHAIVDGDRPALEALLDADAARSRPGTLAPAPGRPFQPPLDYAAVSDIRPIRIFGNSRIALVLVNAIASGEDFYGPRQMLFLFRNQGSGWRILYIDPNATTPFATRQDKTADTVPLLGAFEARVVGDQAEAPPPLAVLVDPPDHAVLPRFPERPEIAWRSEAPDTASFIVEWQFSQPGVEGDWSISTLVFVEAPRTTQPFRQRAPFGVGAQPHRWRVWTLGRSGAVSVSSWRTLCYSN